MSQHSGLDHLFGRVLSNSSFDVQDESVLTRYLSELNYWSLDLRDLRARQSMLESTSVYFASKYDNRHKSIDAHYQRLKYQLRKALRDTGAKGEAIDAELYQRDDYFSSKLNRDAASELKDTFDKLYWMVVRKHERIEDQSTQDSRQGG